MTFSTPLFLGLFPAAITGNLNTLQGCKALIASDLHSHQCSSVRCHYAVSAQKGVFFCHCVWAPTRVRFLDWQPKRGSEACCLQNDAEGGRQTALGKRAHTSVNMQTSFICSAPATASLKDETGKVPAFTLSEEWNVSCQIWCFQCSYENVSPGKLKMSAGADETHSPLESAYMGQQVACLSAMW